MKCFWSAFHIPRNLSISNLCALLFIIVNTADNTIRCPSDSVMAPTNGMVSYSSPEEGGGYVFGTVATFSCSPGFGLSTLETRTCAGENDVEIGTFSGSSPTCYGEIVIIRREFIFVYIIS